VLDLVDPAATGPGISGIRELNAQAPMTAAGYLALENELKHRIRVERPRLIQRIQEAIADDSNLAENSEYQSAKAEQEFNEARVAELEDKLARAEVIDVSKLSGDIIKFGATVTLTDKDTGNEKVWQIVGEPEADANKGRISVTSPIARALIGKAKGATVEVEAPGGAKVYKVRQVEWLEVSQHQPKHFQSSGHSQRPTGFEPCSTALSTVFSNVSTSSGVGSAAAQ
jgi:transcription elongation factor GreA